MILLDTAVVVWWLADDPALGATARAAISDADTVYVSAASIWELSIKQAQNRLQAPDGYIDVLLEAGFAQLGIEWEHARLAGTLPPHHRDPFDRMLVAQATVEHLAIVTPDPVFGAYGVPVIPA